MSITTIDIFGQHYTAMRSNTVYYTAMHVVMVSIFTHGDRTDR